MNKYLISYKRNGKQVYATRSGDCATEAIDKLCNQYKWNWKVGLVDADTRGKQWTSAYVDEDGGINYNLFVLCKERES